MPGGASANHELPGLGVMGYPMALNLLKGLGPEKTLLICDVATDALERFQAEAKCEASVTVVQNGFEAAKAAVRKGSAPRLELD